MPLYGELAALAVRVLKPGGWCIAMAGNLYLDRIFDMMRASGLEYHGLITVSFSAGGYHARIGKTFQVGKRIVLFQKPPAMLERLWGPDRTGSI